MLIAKILWDPTHEVAARKYVKQELNLNWKENRGNLCQKHYDGTKSLEEISAILH